MAGSGPNAPACAVTAPAPRLRYPGIGQDGPYMICWFVTEPTFVYTVRCGACFPGEACSETVKASDSVEVSAVVTTVFCQRICP